MGRFGWGGLALTVLLASCSHAPPQIAQVFDQVDRVFDPVTGGWTERLAVFVQGDSGDGTKVFDRLHVIYDQGGLYFTLRKGEWRSVERPGEFWVGAKGLSFPDGKVPTGSWRAELVTRSGQKVESEFQVPPPAPDAPPPRSGPVLMTETGTRCRVAGWVDDYLVWAYDSGGSVLSRAKTVGPEFTVPPGAVKVVLYSYDKARGEGLEAGPFVLKENAKPADR